MIRPTILAASAVGLALLAGCAVGPDYKKPDLTLPSNWASLPEFKPAEPGDGKLKGNWWEMFGDAQLNELEQRALAHNQSLVIAAEHLKQARLQVTVTSAAQLPSADVLLSEARNKTSTDRPLAAYDIPNSAVVQNNPQLGLVVNYEADLFGRVRRVVESANAAAAQAAADFENARLVLMADLATSYFNLREQDQEIDILQKSVQLQQQALEFVRVRRDLDYATGLDFAQQQAQLEASKTQLAVLQNQRAALQNAIATLTGTPAPEFKLAPQPVTQNLPAVPVMPVSLPSDVLQRRPDVASAERAMAVANANIGVAKAAYYPALMLQASGGWNSNQWSNLISAPSILWSLGAGMTEHLFDAGKTTANVNIAESSYAAALANYRQSVLVAMQEVQTGINSMAILDKANQSAQAAAQSSARAYDIATARYNGGVDIFLNVITAQQSLLANQRQAAQIQGQQLTNAVYLIKAMGGGWQGLGVPETLH